MILLSDTEYLFIVKTCLLLDTILSSLVNCNIKDLHIADTACWDKGWNNIKIPHDLLGLCSLMTFKHIKCTKTRICPGLVEKCIRGPSVLFCKLFDHDFAIAICVLIPFNCYSVIVASPFSLDLGILLAILAFEN